MDRLTIDFETYYDSEYSLTGLSYPEYILHPVFQVVGVSVSKNGDTPDSFTGSHARTKEWLKQYDWENSLCVAHNAHFDAAIMAWVFDIYPAKYFCTMQASRPYVSPYSRSVSLDACTSHYGIGVKGKEVLNAKGIRREAFSDEQMTQYMLYCDNDVKITDKLYCVLTDDECMPVDERDIVSLTIRKYVNAQLMADEEYYLEEIEAHKENNKKIIEESGISKSVLGSNPQFAKELEKRGIPAPKKISPTTGKETFALAKSDAPFKAIMYGSGEEVRKLCEARLAVKSTQTETRLRRFISIASVTGGLFPCALSYWAAKTGRFGGTDKTNLQNMKRGGALRKGLVAPDGYAVVAGDLSQIEARVTAALAGQWDLVSEFKAGEDVYSSFASILYDKPINKDEHPNERFIGKTCILGLGYGMGVNRFSEQLASMGHEVTPEFAELAVQTYRKSYSKIRALWYEYNNVLDAMISGQEVRFGPITTGKDCINLPNGMKLIYHKLSKDKSTGNYTYMYAGKLEYIYGAKLVENVVQALARIIITRAELTLAEYGMYACLSVHDELVFVIEHGLVDKSKRAIEIVMNKAPPWLKELPVACEVLSGSNYAECK